MRDRLTKYRSNNNDFVSFVVLDGIFIHIFILYGLILALIDAPIQEAHIKMFRAFKFKTHVEEVLVQLKIYLQKVKVKLFCCILFIHLFSCLVACSKSDTKVSQKNLLT